MSQDIHFSFFNDFHQQTFLTEIREDLFLIYFDEFCEDNYVPDSVCEYVKEQVSCYDICVLNEYFIAFARDVIFSNLELPSIDRMYVRRNQFTGENMAYFKKFLFFD